MKELQTRSRSRAYNAGARIRTALVALPVTLYGLAGASASAQDAATQLTSGAKTQMEAAIPLIVGLLVVGIGITVAFMVNKNAKKGINKAG